MRRVIIESPFAAHAESEVDRTFEAARNVRYAKACMKDCFHRHEAPFASHLLYPQILNDDEHIERMIGILAGQVWGLKADAIVCYTDLGISEGMRASLNVYMEAQIPIEYRVLPHEEWKSP